MIKQQLEEEQKNLQIFEKIKKFNCVSLRVVDYKSISGKIELFLFLDPKKEI